MTNTPDGTRLASYISRIENLEAQKKEIQDDIKDIFTEIKSAGYTPKIVRQLIRERAMDKQQLEEERQLLEIYRDALGQLADTPLGEAALRR